MIDRNIPLAADAMRIRLLSVSDAEVKTSLPYEGNANDKGTLFAGAIFYLLVVSGWSLAMARAFACGFEHPWAAGWSRAVSITKLYRLTLLLLPPFRNLQILLLVRKIG